MLDLMRKYTGTWMIKIIFGIIIIVFAFWGVGSFKADKNKTVAQVNGQIITIEEFWDEYNKIIEQARKNFGKNFDDDMIKALGLKRHAVDKIIEQKLLIQEAKKLNLKVSEQELTNAIYSLKVFHENGEFSKNMYKRVLNYQKISPEKFEVVMGESMLIEKLINFITAGIKVSDIEVMEWYQWINTSVNIDFICFDPARYDDVKPLNEEVKKHFEDNKNSYKTKPEIEARYLYFDPDSYTSNIDITQTDIQEYFDANTEKFKEPLSDETRNEIRATLKMEKANSIAYDEAERVYETSYNNEDFVKIAKQQNLNLITTDFFTDRGPVKGVKNQTGFAAAAFNLPVMQISDIIDLEDGYYIIQVTKKISERIPDFADVKEKVLSDFTKLKKNEKASIDAKELLAELKKGGSMIEAEKKYNLTPVSTGFFKRNQPIPGIGYDMQIAESSFGLSDKTKFPENVIKNSKGYYVLEFKGKQKTESENSENEKTEIKEKIFERKQAEIFNTWMKEIKSRSEISYGKGYQGL